MALLDGLRERGAIRQLQRDLQQERWQVQHLAEGIRDLEDQLVDDGWRRMVTNLDREFTRQGLDDLMRMSRAMYLAHPLIQRAVNVRAYYTWAQGVHVQAVDENVQALIDALHADPGNKAELFGHQARILTDVDQSTDGNVFLTLPTSANGAVSVRGIPAEEIREIHCDPNDRRTVWFYRRRWTECRFDLSSGLETTIAREALYPDFRLRMAGGAGPAAIGSVEVMWDSPVVHQRTGGLKHMQFGVPETYAALDWARAYQKFLEDWHTIVASLSRFAWRLTTKGSKIKQAKDRLGSTITADDPIETNRPSSAGSTFIGSESDQMVPISKTGATTNTADAKPARLMVAAAMDLPDTILSGDADQGNLATAKTLDRPTELAIRSRQQMWADLDQDVYSYVIHMAQLRGGLGRVEDATVNVSFPSVVAHDMQTVVSAIVTAATLNGQAEAGTIPVEQLSRMLLQALGVEDVESVLEKLEADHADGRVADLSPEQRETLLGLVHALG